MFFGFRWCDVFHTSLISTESGAPTFNFTVFYGAYEPFESALEQREQQVSGVTLLTQLPSAIADSLIPGCNRIWDRQHEDLSNPPLRTSVIPLKILCIQARLKSVATAEVKRISLAESDLLVFIKEK